MIYYNDWLYASPFCVLIAILTRPALLPSRCAWKQQRRPVLREGKPAPYPRCSCMKFYSSWYACASQNQISILNSLEQVEFYCWCWWRGTQFPLGYSMLRITLLLRNLLSSLYSLPRGFLILRYYSHAYRCPNAVLMEGRTGMSSSTITRRVTRLS